VLKDEIFNDAFDTSSAFGWEKYHILSVWERPALSVLPVDIVLFVLDDAVEMFQD
jgi:hypothetical protein